jgi:transcriptional regulator NrdR family protein
MTNDGDQRAIDWVDCSYHEEHARKGLHKPHPVYRRRRVCMLCHPPITTRLSAEARLVAIAKAAGVKL